MKFAVDRPVYGRLGQLIESNHPDYVERLSGSELRAGIRVGFRTAECFAALSKLNRQIRICRQVTERHMSAMKKEETQTMNDELKTVEEACCVAVEYAARHDADEQVAKSFATTWVNMGEGAERSAGALERLLKRHLDI